MNRSETMKVFVAIALCAVGLLAVSGRFLSVQVMAQDAPACLHGDNEAPDQRARRGQALNFARHINALEANSFPSNKSYLPVDRLTITQSVPSGFTLSLSTSGRDYAFSVIDSNDPCLFGYFSDEKGIIYRGEVIRPGRS
jgi:hypothetical protein